MELTYMSPSLIPGTTWLKLKKENSRKKLIPVLEVLWFKGLRLKGLTQYSSVKTFFEKKPL